jgi:signal peptidase I
VASDSLDPQGPPGTGESADPFGDADPLDREDVAERGDSSGARSFWRELPVLIVVALVVAVLIKTFLVQAFFIPSASMRETLVEGDRVMVNKLSYRFGEPEPGDIIVFHSPLVPDNGNESFLGAIFRNIGEALGISTPDTALIKRVIAVGGQTIEIRDNAVFVDGIPVDEPYLGEDSRMGAFGPLEVPADHVFVMGDNRNQSEIIGRAFVRVWPPSRWGGL